MPIDRPAILLTGVNGQLGFELARLLAPVGEVIAADRTTLDLADADAIVAAVRGVRPKLIVNAAAYTAVDLAEKESAKADAINARAPAIFAEEARRLGAVLIHYSTDYVFDGAGKVPYTEDDPVNPLNVYGATKLAGERNIDAVGAHALVFRTSWVYGLRGKNFLLTIKRLAAEREELLRRRRPDRGSQLESHPGASDRSAGGGRPPGAGRAVGSLPSERNRRGKLV